MNHRWLARLGLALVPAAMALGAEAQNGSSAAVIEAIPLIEQENYADHRPHARYRLQVSDAGVVLRHGYASGQCDLLGARDVWVFKTHDGFVMHYDGAGPKGWLICRAASKDLVTWVDLPGPALDLGDAGRHDSASASYGTTFHDGATWHMFYLGTPFVTAAPDRVPAREYLTMKAEAGSPYGPWVKRYDIAPLSLVPGTYHEATASPGFIVKRGSVYRMFFSAGTANVKRTIGIARSVDLDKPWKADNKPALPLSEQLENTTLYYQKSDRTWFMFTNHVGIKDGIEYTDAIWVYWTKNLDRWDPRNKAIALDSRIATWTPYIVGLPSVVRFGNRLALFYDGRTSPKSPIALEQEHPTGSHMGRDIGLAWISLPIQTPGHVRRSQATAQDTRRR